MTIPSYSRRLRSLDQSSGVRSLQLKTVFVVGMAESAAEASASVSHYSLMICRLQLCCIDGLGCDLHSSESQLSTRLPAMGMRSSTTDKAVSDQCKLRLPTLRKGLGCSCLAESLIRHHSSTFNFESRFWPINRRSTCTELLSCDPCWMVHCARLLDQSPQSGWGFVAEWSASFILARIDTVCSNCTT